MVRTVILAILVLLPLSRSVAEEVDYYPVVTLLDSSAATDSRATVWKPGKGLVLEVSGLELLSDDRLAIAIRKGEVWMAENPFGDPKEIRFKQFASALLEPLGVMQQGDSLVVAQRTELTRIRDADGDGRADEYLTHASGWHVSGNYHAYIYGPKADGKGNLWLTTNIDIGSDSRNDLPWSGWALRVGPDGQVAPIAAGMRSPCALGVNGVGDVFFADQQGDWIPTNSLHHIRPGVFFGNPNGVFKGNGIVELSAAIPSGRSYPDAVCALPELVPPAVWFPYKKVGRSPTDIVLDTSKGKFGPFGGQLFISDFTHAMISRVFLEKVDGEYQGACFKFREGFPSAVVRLAMSDSGVMFVGMTNRGWSSRGGSAYGLQRMSWSGKVPFEVKEMRAKPDGFELVFTQPVDVQTAKDAASYAMSSYTYRYHRTYGSPEINTKSHAVQVTHVSADKTRVRIAVPGLRPMYVHELRLPGIRSNTGQPLLHPEAYYTLNRIPRQ